MLLAIDLGNTNLTIGMFNERQLSHTWRLSSDAKRTADEYGLQLSALLRSKGFTADDVNGIILSSVVPPVTEWVVQACRVHLNQEPLLVSTDLQLNVTIKYDDPKAVGADRIADAVAARTRISGSVCVIDFGTATTFNAVTSIGEYLGGAILPGISTAADALVSKAAKLPPFELIAPPSVIGTNTRHAMQAGLIFGYASLVDGMVERFRFELGDEMAVIGTGGHVETIASHTKSLDHIEPWLTLEGLQIIWEMNT